MSQEVVIVSYASSLHRSAWLATYLDQHTRPLCPTSILLTDHVVLHPILRMRWLTRVVQFLADGSRWKNEQPDGRWLDHGTAYTPKHHADALRIAALTAKGKDYSVRSFLAFTESTSTEETCHDLWRHRNLSGDIVCHSGAPEPRVAENETLLWLDTETTGVSKRAVVIEIGAILTDASGAQVLDRFEARSDIPSWAEVQQQALEINGYLTHPRWKQKGDHVAMVEKFLEWLPHRPALAGHNLSFDQRMIEQTMVATKYPFPSWRGCGLDTMRIAKKIQQQTSKISSCALESLCYQFGISTQGLHSAAVDIEATRQVYLCLKKMMTNLMADEPARASL